VVEEEEKLGFEKEKKGLILFKKDAAKKIM
jgi:hypothetical protein